MTCKVVYKPCPTCEGQGFLLECQPRFVDGETGKGGTFLRFSVNPDRGVPVPCHRCEGLKRVPVKRRIYGKEQQ